MLRISHSRRQRISLPLGLVFSLQIFFGCATHADLVRIERVEEVVEKTRLRGDLFVKGDIGVGDAQLGSLAKWLESYPNWTVVLLDRAEGESYRDADGATHYHTDAVEFLLGHQLFGRTEFSARVDPRTQLDYGAILYITFDRTARYRKVGYYAGTSFDRRGLGEAKWKRNLDRLAIEPLKNGRRVVDAVKRPIETIESRLTRAITRAEEERRAAEREAEAGIERLGRAIDQLREDLNAARDRYPEVDSTRFDFDPVNVAMLESAKAGFEGRDLTTAHSWLTQLERELTIRRDELTAFVAVGEALDRSDSELDRAAEQGVATELLRARVAEQRAHWRRGAQVDVPNVAAEIDALRRFPKLLDAVDRRLETFPARERDRRTVSELRERSAMLRERLERGSTFPEASITSIGRELDELAKARRTAEARARQARWTKFIAGLVGVVLATVAVVLLYRRVRRVRYEARRLFLRWDRLLASKTESLWELETRKDQLLGSADEQRFDGDTAALAASVRHLIGELFIMRSLARRHHTSVRPWVEPDRWAIRTANWFLARYHERALKRLSDERVVYERESGLEAILREGQNTPEIDLLAADLDQARPFELSFDELMEAFNGRAEECLANLAVIERATHDIYDALRELDSAIAVVEEDAATLEPFARRERSLALAELTPCIERVLRPAAKSANRLSTRDPVRAVRIARQAQRVAALVGSVTTPWREATGTRIAVVRKRERDLAELGSSPTASTGGRAALPVARVSPAWIDRELVAIGGAGDEWLAHLSVETAIAPDLVGALYTLEQRIERARELDGRRRDTVPHRILDRERLLDEARSEFGRQLDLEPTVILREGDPGLDRMLEKARTLHHNSAEAISVGELDRAERDLRLAVEFAARVEATIEETRVALHAHEERRSGALSRVDALTEVLPSHDEILRELERDFTAEVVEPHAADAAYRGANETLADNIDEASRTLAEARIAIDTAVACHRNGAILEADARLDAVLQDCEFVDFRLAEIVERRALVDETVAANRAKLSDAQSSIEGERSRWGDPRTTRASQVIAGEVEALALRAAEIENESPGRPFSAARAIETFATELLRVTDAVDRDWAMYAEAKRSAHTAAVRVRAAEREAEWVSTDGIPDNAAIRQACHRVFTELGPSLGHLQSELDQPHRDWAHLDGRAGDIARDATVLRDLLREEGERGRRAGDQLVAAQRAVRARLAWSGGMGVQISGQPGSGLLKSARAAMEAGQYDRVADLAIRAERSALEAIRDAERRVRRRRREAAERKRRQAAARARRAAAARRAASFTSMSSSGGSSGFSSSGFSSSSSGSSGSGFSSSNW